MSRQRSWSKRMTSWSLNTAWKLSWPMLLTALLSLGAVAGAQAERTTTYLHTDGLGSVVAASDESGNVLWRKSYAPYGEQIDAQGDDEALSYTGKPHDADLGLTYFGARYYDPVVGRFMSPDPVGFVEDNPMSFNRYLYVNNNPYKYVDPDGNYLETLWDLANIGLGVVNLNSNVRQGNYWAATVDGAGIVYDTFAAIVPVLPAAAGAARHATDAAIDGARRTNLDEVGSYTNTHASGKEYSGKGSRKRSQQSGRRKAREHNDPHVATDFTPAANDREAFKQESHRTVLTRAVELRVAKTTIKWSRRGKGIVRKMESDR